VVGALSGAPLAVIGHAAGLSAMVFQLVQQHGIEALGVITVSAGMFQMLFAAARAGRLFDRLPQAVLEGTLSAIGIIIVLGQVHVLMGQAVPSNPVQAVLNLGASA